MKKILFFVTSLFALTQYAQVTILNADFNNGIPTGWQLIDNDQLVPYNDNSVNFMTNAWNLVEDYDSTGIGDSILVATSWFETSGEADDYLISPAITLGNYGNFISFDLRSIDASHPDGFQVLYSTEGTALSDFSNSPLLYDSIAISPYWTRYTVNLDEFSLNNQTIHFAFRHYATDQYVLALDNISIVINDPVSIDETISTLFQFYPNPATDRITFENIEMGQPITITDLSGQLIQTLILNNKSIDIDLPNGLYLINVGGTVQKLIIK
ncbi:MAG: choice-of-anchor J domain-containing protein [Flavobacteriales bacterium]|jgi:hypothetical protein|nr:choice-of-anchor J domain-containing protein [Flavobacteriales bacterium]